MSLRDDLAGVLARDPRYSIQAYAFVFEALEYTKSLKKRTPGASPRPWQGQLGAVAPRHRPRALRRGPPAGPRPLRADGADRPRTTGASAPPSDIGEIVYNLIASGDLEKTPERLAGRLRRRLRLRARLPPRLRPGAGRGRLNPGAVVMDESRNVGQGPGPAAVLRRAGPLPALGGRARRDGGPLRPPTALEPGGRRGPLARTRPAHRPEGDPDLRCPGRGPPTAATTPN